MKPNRRERDPLGNQSHADREGPDTGETDAIRVREAIGSAVRDAYTAADPEESEEAPLVSPSERGNFPWLLVAAVLVVGVIALWDSSNEGPTDNDEAGRMQVLTAEDDEVRIRLEIPASRLGHPFETMPLSLQVTPKTEGSAFVIDNMLNLFQPEQASRIVAQFAARGDIPLRMVVEFTDVDGTKHRSVQLKDPWEVREESFAKSLQQPPPYRTVTWPSVAVADDGPVDWSSRAQKPNLKDGPRRYLLPTDRSFNTGVMNGDHFRPSGPGVVTTTIRFERLPPTDGSWWRAAAPLELRFQTRVGGRYGEWSETVDGLRGRLVVPEQIDDPDRIPVALQLQNVGKDTVAYNFVGVTSAKIPQPMHFELQIDGRTLEQQGSRILITPGLTFTHHHPGKHRWISSTGADWHLNAELGRAREAKLSYRFEFKPTLVTMKTRVWQNVLQTPAVTIERPQ